MRVFQPNTNIPSPKGLTRWMVLDGAQLPELAKNIASIRVRFNQELEYVSLLLGTRWERVSDLGPYLVQWSLEVEQWAYENAPYRYGVIFDSKTSFEEIELHWKRLIDCQHRGLEGALNRLYDPVVFRYLLQVAEDARLNYWLGPMQCLWLPDCFGEHYWQVDCSPEPSSLLENAQFNDQEWQSLCNASLAYTAWRLVRHVEQFFPANALETSQQTHRFVLQQLNDLKQLGHITEQSAIYYLNVICRLGNVLDKDTRYPEVASDLKDSTIPLSERLKRANQMSIHLAHKQSNLVESC